MYAPPGPIVEIIATRGRAGNYAISLPTFCAAPDRPQRTYNENRRKTCVAINNNFGAHSIPELCWLAYPDCHIFWYNERWYGYAGTGPDQTEGWGWQAVHDPKILHEGLERW